MAAYGLRVTYINLTLRTAGIIALPTSSRSAAKGAIVFKALHERKQRERVRQLLAGYISRNYLPQVSKTDRRFERRAFCEVVWMVGWDEQNQAPDFDRVRHAVTRDVNQDGLSLLLTAPLDDEQLLIGLDSGGGSRHFIRCLLEYCNPLGYGFYQAGLHAEELVELDPLDIERLKQSARPLNSEAVGVV